MNYKKTKFAVALLALIIPGFSFQGQAQKLTWEQFEKEYIYPELRGLPIGSADSDYRTWYEQNLYTKPEMTSSTIKVIVDGLEGLQFSDFYEGIAYVRTYHDGAFYIDRNGKKLFETKSHEVAGELPHFDNGVVMELHDGIASIRDKSGKVIKSFKASSVTNFNGGIAMVEIVEWVGKYKKDLQTHYRIVNTKGEFVYPHLWSTKTVPVLFQTVKFDSDSYRMNNLQLPLMPSTEGISAFAKFNNSIGKFEWGFFETATGKLLVKPSYTFVHPFKDGMAAVEVGRGRDLHRWGFVNTSGVEVIAPKYSKIPSDFSDGYARVLNTKDHAYIIDKTGNIVKGPFIMYPKNEEEMKSKAGFYISPFNNGYAIMAEELEGGVFYDYEKIYYAIDKNFNKLAWARFDVLTLTLDHVNNKDISLQPYFQCTEDIVSHNYRIDPKTFNVISTNLQKPYFNGLSRFHRGERDLKIGYIDRDNKYVIVFEKSEF